MAWLRLDDRFAHHPKVHDLTDREFRVHVEAMLFCAEYGTAGVIPPSSLRLLRATPGTINKLVSAGLWDREGTGAGTTLAIHNWTVYNGGTIEEKVSAYLERHPEASANEVQRAVGGKREIVLQAVATIRGTGEPEGTGGTGSRAGTESVPLARAREPVPSLEEHQQQGSNGERPAAAEIDQTVNQIGATLRDAGWTPSQLSDAAEDPARAIAWLEHAAADETVRAPGALAWEGFKAGGWPAVLRDIDDAADAGPVYADPSKVCDQCGATLGEGHLETCPKIARPAEASA